jgi:hypothetical protein
MQNNTYNNRKNDPQDFDVVKLGVASPEKILEWSFDFLEILC